MRISLFFLFVKFNLFLLLTGCSNGSGDCNNDCVTEKLECNCCPELDSSKIIEVPLSAVDIFIEASGSMAGYMPTGDRTTAFQSIVPDIIRKISKNYPTKLYTIKEASPEILTPVLAANKIMKGGFLPWGNNTSLPVMLDSINNYQSENSVTLLISDLIYSPKENREVSQAITRISAQIGEKNVSTTLFALYSDFTGKNIASDKSPYYILLQGKPENIDKVKLQILSSLSLFNQQYDEVNFGRKPIKPIYSIVPYAELSGSGEAVICTGNQNRFLAIKKVSENDTSKFWVGINFPNGPNYIDDEDYLKKNIRFANTGIEASIAEIAKRETFEKRLDDEEDKNIAKQYFYFIRLHIYNLKENTGFVNIKISKPKPQWITGNNHDDQNLADLNRNKTYGLNNIYLAMQDAYLNETANQLADQITIPISKN